MSSFGDDNREDGTAPLILTKLERPRVARDLVERPHLIKSLNRGFHHKLTLISAQAGSGKSTLLSQWLQQCSRPSAWLSLDSHDNDLVLFATYLCEAIQTVIADSCSHVLDLLNAPQAPPPRAIITSMVNELTTLCESRNHADIESGWNGGFILALDDYHSIKEPSVHELVSELITYLPHCIHLLITSRTDPPLPLTGMRARGEIFEFRTSDLRFDEDEARMLLEMTAGRELSSETVKVLKKKTEGWVVGLRLAGISLREHPDEKKFAERFKGTSNPVIIDYLMGDVLSRRSPEQQDFLLRTSFLERFSADLCDDVLMFEDDLKNNIRGSSRSIIQGLISANLFVLPLDQEARWYRYHHLFRDLLQHRLQHQYDEEVVQGLHYRASRWFEQSGFIDEALTHAFSAGNLDYALGIVSRQRYHLMNQARWQRLHSYLRLFPDDYANQQPELLLLNAWLNYHSGHYDRLPKALAQLETAMGQAVIPPKSMRLLKGESSALVSLLSYYGIDEERTFAAADFSIKNTASELWIVRTLARLLLAGAYQMRGELNKAYQAIYSGADEEGVQSNRLKSTMLMTSCYIYWLAADIEGLLQVANQCLELFDYPHSTEIKGYVHYHLGCAYYMQNNLSEAERHFSVAYHQPHLNYGDCYAHSAFGLSLTYLAQNRAEAAQKVAAAALDFLRESGNTTLLPVAQAFQFEVSVREGQLAGAISWADQFDTPPPLSAMLQIYQPYLTLVKIWLAEDNPASRQRAAELLHDLKFYTESTHNINFSIQVLALLALLRERENDEPAAFELLKKSIGLAESGRLIRIYVDLGKPMASLLRRLLRSGESSEYINMILGAFPETSSGDVHAEGGTAAQTNTSLVDPLTPRELEVLQLLARRLTNREIASELFVSLGTVKTHTLSIYTKLDVHDRRRAVRKAVELGLLSPER